MGAPQLHDMTPLLTSDLSAEEVWFSLRTAAYKLILISRRTTRICNAEPLATQLFTYRYPAAVVLQDEG